MFHKDGGLRFSVSIPIAAWSRFCVLGLLLWVLPGCAVGVAAIVGIVLGTTDDPPDGNSPPSLSVFKVDNSRSPPATIHFVVADNEGDQVSVELFYQAPGQPLEPITQVPANPVIPTLGVDPAISWNFAAEKNLPADGSFLDGVRVVARISGLPDTESVGPLGNDPPELSVTKLEQEDSSIIPAGLRVSDSSSDILKVQVEFRVLGDPPGPWKPARPAGLDDTPDPALSGIEASPSGVDLVFFWDTDVDLPDLERDVELRFTPSDSVKSGTPVVKSLRVDNNDGPIVFLDSGPLVSNPDARRGIPVPFTVIDDESDIVQVIFQWQRPNLPFPDLPSDPSKLRRILSDPGLRLDHQVCTPYPRLPQGRILTATQDSARLPELLTTETAYLAAGIEGRTLELLRPPQALRSATGDWDQTTLLSPAACLPLGDGLTALVLDQDGGGARLREIELSTGKVVRTLATLSGSPTAMAFEREERSVLVATDLGSSWKIERVVCGSADPAPSPQLLFASGPGDPPPPVRGLLSLSRNGALATAGDALLRLDWSSLAAPRSARVLEKLSTPGGLVADPVRVDVFYVAERDAGPGGVGRIAVADLRRRHAEPLFVAPGAVTLDRPESLAMENHGTRLLVVMNPGNGSTRLLAAIELGPRGGNRIDPVGDLFPAGRASIAAGAGGLRAVVVGDRNEVLVTGGVEQSRRIIDYDHALQTVTVDEPFHPVPLPGQLWRFAVDGQIRTSSGGVKDTFIWDSRDVPAAGPVILRASSFDPEPGLVVVAGAPKTVRATYDVEPEDLGFRLSEAIAADLDLDGDPDLVGNDNDGLAIRFQGPARKFGNPTVLPVNGARFISAGDIDGNGLVDIICSEPNSSRVVVLFQTNKGVFGEILRTSVQGPELALADFDGDSLLDFVAREDGTNLRVFRQTSPRVFAPVGAPIPMGLNEDSFNSLAADLDNDGDIDVAILKDRSVSVGLQNAGTFSTASVDFKSEGLIDLTAADLNGDGALDLAAGEIDDGFIVLSFQSAPGQFAEVKQFADSGILGLLPHPTATDVDGDGDQDLLVRKGAVFVQTGSDLSLEPIVSLPTEVNSAADLDLDGVVDILQEGGGSPEQTFSVSFQSSPGASFQTLLIPVPQDPEPSVDPRPTQVHAADLNRDGVLDLVSENDEKLTVFFQSLPGSFGLIPLILPCDSQLGGCIEGPLAAGDIDRDGDTDLLHGRRIFFQTAAGTFQETPALAESIDSAALGDLDGDGDLDLVTADSTAVTIRFQSLSGAFDQSLSLGGETPVFVAVADFDADGRLDVAVSDTGSNQVTVSFQTAPNTFQPVPFTCPSAPGPLVPVDLDGDGDLDLACACANEIALFFQTSARTFVLQQPPIALQADSLAAVDLDRDGDVDLLTNEAKVLQGSPGRFESEEVSFGVFHIAVDLDGDGDPDVASAVQPFLVDDHLSVFFGGR